MGINNLNVLLRKHCPKVYETIHISEYAFKKVAIDTSLFLCKFKCISPNWLDLFVKLVACLRKNEIHCVFIYDTGSPPEKADEKAERRAQQEKNKKRVIDLETSLEKYYNIGILDDILLELHEKSKKDNFTVPKKRLLQAKKIDFNDKIDIQLIISKIDKMRSNILDISPADFALTKTLFDILNIPYYDAPVEAETTCSDLCKRGIVDAVLSEDTDVLAYSTPVFLTKIDVYNDTCVRLHHDEILKSLEITKEQFLDLCIMCGCDYNKNIPKVGIESSLKYIKKYVSIEEIGKETKLDIKILNHVRTRELFTDYKEIELTSVPFCGVPDFPALEKFVIDNKLMINIEKLEKYFTHNIVIIEDDDDLANEEETRDTNMEVDDSIIILEEDNSENEEEL
jgi:5'-3' exonuclease